MRKEVTINASEVSIWERLLVPPGDELSPQKARLLLQLRFPEEDLRRMRGLSAKARAGTLNANEQADMDVYERVGHLVSILKSRARQVLRKTRARS
jgi:hypothetical protein